MTLIETCKIHYYSDKRLKKILKSLRQTELDKGQKRYSAIRLARFFWAILLAFLWTWFLGLVYLTGWHHGIENGQFASLLLQRSAVVLYFLKSLEQFCLEIVGLKSTIAKKICKGYLVGEWKEWLKIFPALPLQSVPSSEEVENTSCLRAVNLWSFFFFFWGKAWGMW